VICSIAVFSAPLFVLRSADFPARCVDDAPLQKEGNLIVFNAPVYAQRRGDTRVQQSARLCARTFVAITFTSDLACAQKPYKAA